MNLVFLAAPRPSLDTSPRWMRAPSARNTIAASFRGSRVPMLRSGRDVRGAVH